MHNWLCFGGKKKRDQKYLSFKAPSTNDHTSNNPVAVSNKYEQKASIKNDRKASSKHELKATSKNKLKATSKNELRGQVDSKGQPSSTDNAGHGQARVFNYSELATSTRNFHPDNFLGEGGFGSVYKGVLCGTDKVVAVKRLNPTGFQGEKEFLVEVLMLSLLRHPNLVHMIGYCAEGSQRLLVLEFMPMGSLEAHLHDIPPDREPLDWDTRMKIAEGAAKGVAYLHNEAKPSVIFRDLKPSNILLDNEFNAKLSDFGLAKFGPVGDSTHVSTRVMGTHGYCAPEYFKTGKLTVKSDTFSFGVVLLELISGRRAMGGRLSLVDWARPLLRDPKSYRYLADPRLKGNYSMSALHRAIEVASMCLREHASGRPTMQEVALAMNYLTSKKHERSRSISEGIPCDISLRESGMNIRPDFNREQAIAEAKLWGEQWREKRRQSEGARSEALSSWVTQVNKDL